MPEKQYAIIVNLQIYRRVNQNGGKMYSRYLLITQHMYTTIHDMMRKQKTCLLLKSLHSRQGDKMLTLGT